MMGYNEICSLTHYTVDRDNHTQAPWAYSGDQWMCYDDVNSINIKVTDVNFSLTYFFVISWNHHICVKLYKILSFNGYIEQIENLQLSKVQSTFLRKIIFVVLFL